MTTFLSVLGEVFGEGPFLVTPLILRFDTGEDKGLGPDRPTLRFRCGLPTTGDFWGGVRGGVFKVNFGKDGDEDAETSLLAAKGLLLEL